MTLFNDYIKIDNKNIKNISLYDENLYLNKDRNWLRRLFSHVLRTFSIYNIVGVHEHVHVIVHVIGLVTNLIMIISY